MHFSAQIVFQKVNSDPLAAQVSQEVPWGSAEIYKYKKDKNIITSQVDFKTVGRRVQR